MRWMKAVLFVVPFSCTAIDDIELPDLTPDCAPVSGCKDLSLCCDDLGCKYRTESETWPCHGPDCTNEYMAAACYLGCAPDEMYCAPRS